LTSFPYYTNYLALSRLEASLIESFMPHQPKKLAFIGSGPLPLTSLCMLDHFPRATVHNIDRDAGALQLSRELCDALGCTRMRFACEDVSAPTGAWDGFKVVFLAALVGMSAGEKIAVLKGLAGKLGPGTLVVARSARGLRGVLYPVSGLRCEEGWGD
jgi:nicotianamine synthase